MTVPADVSSDTLEKLRKLMAHEASAREIGSVAEAESFAEKIQELLIKYHLDAADIEQQHEAVDDEVSQQLVEDATSPAKSARIAWEEWLASAVAPAHFCRILVRPRSNYIWMVGKPADREVAAYMFIMLRRMIRETSLKEYSRYFDQCQLEGHVQDARGYRASWINAAVAALAKRFTETRQRADQSSAGTAIVLANADLAVQDFMQKYTHNAGGIRGKSSRNGAGTLDGRAWGSSVSIDGRGLGNGRSSTPRGALS